MKLNPTLRNATFVGLVVVLISASGGPWLPAGSANDGKSTARAPIHTPTVGEKLTYDVSWSSFVVAGELTLRTQARRDFDGTDAYHLTAQAESIGLVRIAVLKVNDTYESFIAAQTLKPFRAVKTTRHGNRRERSIVEIDQGRQVAILEDGTEIAIPEETYDLVGLVYAIRSMDLKPGNSRTFTLLDDGKLYRLQVTPEEKETVQLRTGKYEAVRITTGIIGRETRDPYKLKIYITPDSRRLPVLILAEPFWGQVRVELTSSTGTPEK